MNKRKCNVLADWWVNCVVTNSLLIQDHCGPLFQVVAWTPGSILMSSQKKEHSVKKEVPTQLNLRHAVSLSRDSQGIYSLTLTLDGQELMVGFGNGAIQVE